MSPIFESILVMEIGFYNFFALFLCVYFDVFVLNSSN